MNLRLFLILFLASISLTAQEQRKAVTLEEIWGGEFQSEGLRVLRSMKDGSSYTVLNFQAGGRVSSIDKYDYRTREKTASLLSSVNSEIPFFTNYEFSEDESKVLLATDVEPVFRHSTLAIYYVYDLKEDKLSRIAEGKIREPALSPEGDKVAYVFENNLYLFDVKSGSTAQLTSDGKWNEVINGVTDWVYEEEFAFVRAFQWNSEGSKIAFLRFDERKVPEFSMDVFGQDLYPFQYRFKYPKAGEENAVVSLHIYDLETANTSRVDLGESYYIPRIKWRNHPDELSVQTLNRHQNHLQLLSVNTRENKVDKLLDEKDAAYVDITDNLTFLQDDSFIWTSEQDGYNHIYLYDQDGKLMNQVTRGDWEVTQYYGYDQAEDRVYYQSTENGSINRDVYAISSSGKNKKRLSQGDGTHDADFNADFSLFINEFSSATTPPRYTLHRAKDGKMISGILDNRALANKLKGYKISPKEFSTLPVNGYDLNMWMVKPMDFDPAKTYPMLMFQYSGPGSQQVSNEWMSTNDLWHQMLASEGYVVVCVDGRGTGFKGRDFKKLTYRELGKYEVEDQITAAKLLSERPYIDENRTGIWGWSYGGFMSTNCLLKGNDVFEMGIAVAPVTSWRFYDTIYTERYMRTPAENPGGYDENSPFNYPELLKGDYLLVHGSGDDNVHLQNTMRMIDALVQANKPFEWAIYPDRNHGIYGGNTRLHLFGKMTRFVKENL